MSQNPQKPKRKLESKPHNAIIIDLPVVRNFSTGGGHGPEETLVEGDENIVTRKWQGYPPKDLNLVGKPMPPMPEVAIPRFTGKAEYTTRLSFPNMLWVKLLVSPHPRAKIISIDTSVAEKMPGVAQILTYKSVPKGFPLGDQIEYQGDIVAMVAAETEDLAEDAVEAIKVEYQLLPFASTIAQVMSPNAPQLRPNRPNAIPNDRGRYGDVEKGFAQADVVKEFTYYFGGARPVPFQPVGCIAKWDGDVLTFYGTSQGIYPQRAALARGLGIDVEKIHYINKWNGGTFGPGVASERYYLFIAHIAKVTGRPTKLMLPKDQELAQMQVKSENISKFKVGATKDGKIIACQREFFIAGGFNVGNGGGVGEAGGRSELYLHVIPNWKDSGFTYTTNSMQVGASRSNSQQEYKWGWEQMIDEMAEAVGMDPIKFRLLNTQKPGTKVTIASGGPTMVKMPETKDGYLTYDSYAIEEVLAEGAKAIGWERRNPVPGGNPGRFKRGFGVALSQHHAGRVGYHEGEVGFEKVLARGGPTGGGQGQPYNGVLELNDRGEVILHYAQPDSGTNHGTAMATQVAEILGYVTRDHMRVLWGDSAVAPPAPGWNSGLTTQLQGGALNAAADNLRKELLRRASETLKVDQSNLQIREGVIFAKDNPQKKVTFAALAKANGGVIRQTGRCIHPGSIGRAMNRGIGACFVEVEVDTWTGDWKFVRAAYAHDSGKVVNPLVAEGDMNGSLIQSTQITTDAIPTDREFPGTRHYAVGFLSYRLPTIMDVPEATQIFVNSLEPRWFFGCKGFAETSIGAPPGAIANAIYNACGVRIREHPITKEKILAGLRAKGKLG
jgi:CO/xanthine dehydrogenase Mo-binding subunit